MAHDRERTYNRNNMKPAGAYDVGYRPYEFSVALKLVSRFAIQISHDGSENEMALLNFQISGITLHALNCCVLP